jgi:hypothetical protein
VLCYAIYHSARVFAAQIQLLPAGAGAQSVSVNCTAPADAFAFLDKEGETYIHTTTMGVHP